MALHAPLLLAAVLAALLPTHATAMSVSGTQASVRWGELQGPAVQVRHSASLCQLLCAAQPNCRTWTVVTSRWHAQSGLCYRSAKVRPLVSDSCCSTGILQPPAVLSPQEGQLVRHSKSRRIAVVQGGRARPLASFSVLRARGLAYSGMNDSITRSPRLPESSLPLGRLLPMAAAPPSRHVVLRGTAAMTRNRKLQLMERNPFCLGCRAQLSFWVWLMDGAQKGSAQRAIFHATPTTVAGSDGRRIPLSVGMFANVPMRPDRFFYRISSAKGDMSGAFSRRTWRVRQWHHVSIVLLESLLMVFLDGQPDLVLTLRDADYFEDSGDDSSIAFGSSGKLPGFNGLLCNVTLIRNPALSSARLWQLAAVPPPQPAQVWRAALPSSASDAARWADSSFHAGLAAASAASAAVAGSNVSRSGAQWHYLASSLLQRKRSSGDAARDDSGALSQDVRGTLALAQDAADGGFCELAAAYLLSATQPLAAKPTAVSLEAALPAWDGGTAAAEENERVVDFQRKLAAGGDARAEHWLGQQHYWGARGLPQDRAAAARHFQRAADGGNVDALHNLAIMQQTGEGGLPRDRAAAHALFQRAADAGHAAAMNGLGIAQLHGSAAVARNRSAALAHFLAAAEGGSSDGMFNAATLLLDGRATAGVPQQLRALRLLARACERMHVKSLQLLGKAYVQRDSWLGRWARRTRGGVSGNVTIALPAGARNVTYPAQPDCAFGVALLRDAASRLPQRALFRNASSAVNGGRLRQAAAIYHQLAELGFRRALENAAWLAAQADAQAEAATAAALAACERANWRLRQAAARHSAFAARLLGDRLFYGTRCSDVQAEEALRWYERAAALGDLQASFSAAHMLLWGQAAARMPSIEERSAAAAAAFARCSNSSTPAVRLLGHAGQAMTAIVRLIDGASSHTAAAVVAAALFVVAVALLGVLLLVLFVYRQGW